MRFNHQLTRLSFIIVAAFILLSSLALYLSINSSSADAKNDDTNDTSPLPSDREEWVNQSCHQGQTAFNNGDYQTAVANLNRCIPYYTADLHFFIMRGQAWQALGKIDLARIDFDYVLSQDPQHADALRLRSQLDTR